MEIIKIMEKTAAKNTKNKKKSLPPKILVYG
jgi:hypothetical protein